MIDILLSIVNFVIKKQVYGPIITIILACVFYKIISSFIRKIIPTGKDSYEMKKRKTITDLFVNITKYIILIFSALVIMSIFGINVKGLIAGLGITATILGLALQDTFKDIINGISIILENYFIIGDTVVYNGFTGEVIEYGLKTTKIKNINGETLIVANRNIMEIKNISQKDPSVILKFALTYEEDIDKVENVIINDIIPEIANLKDVIEDSCQYMGIADLADSSVNYQLMFKCKRESHWQAKRDANKIALSIFKKNKIKFAYPHMEVSNGK